MKIKVSELPSFDASDSIKTVGDVRDWLKVSLEGDETIEDFKRSIEVLIKAIDNNISKMN